MNHDNTRPRIGQPDSVIARAKSLGVKALVVVAGAVVLASAFAVSLVVLAVALAIVLTCGGYVWWKTRDLRKQMRDRLQAQAAPPGRIIEGELVSRENQDR